MLLVDLDVYYGTIAQCLGLQGAYDIGDILGHRTAESTSMYLRLATGDLREVALAVPGRDKRKEGQC